MTISVTLNVEGDALAPTLKEVLDSMTPEDKSKLVANLAYTYFARDMQQIYKSYNYQDRSHADDFLKELIQQVKTHIGKQLLEDPDLKAKIDTVLEIIQPELPKFIQQAVVSIVAKTVADTFQGLSSLSQETFSVSEKLKQLGTR